MKDYRKIATETFKAAERLREAAEQLLLGRPSLLIACSNLRDACDAYDAVKRDEPLDR